MAPNREWAAWPKGQILVDFCRLLASLSQIDKNRAIFRVKSGAICGIAP